jgi:hypothetical protein
VAGSSETSVSVYVTTWCHNTEDYSLDVNTIQLTFPLVCM